MARHKLVSLAPAISTTRNGVEGSVMKFSAASAALGYLYQVRSALLWTLRRMKSDSDFAVGVETLDDVAFETTGGEPRELLQTKHHRRSQGSLTDGSVDLWKTLRIWFVARASGEIPPHTSLFLVTTANAPEGSAGSRLKATDRDVESAHQALSQVASTSTNAANAAAYAAFTDAGPLVQREVLDQVTVLDSAPGVTDLDAELRQEIHWAVARQHLPAFLERLEGWWLRRILLQLTDTATDRVGSFELESKMGDLRDQFRQDALPIDEDLLEFVLDPATAASYATHSFVQQIELTKAGRQRIAAAIRDYYRAFEQRSRWLRDELLFVPGLQSYERRLVEEWELQFEAVRDELGDRATDAAKEAAARTVLGWAEQTLIPIRANVTEPFVSRGSLHMLSDELRIGWHVDFRDRLAHLLGSSQAVAS